MKTKLPRRRGATARLVRRSRLFALGALLAVSSAAAAPTPGAPVPGGRALLDEVRALNRTTRHWTDRHQVLDLTIVDRRGGERERSLEMWTKRYDDDASKTLLFFREPPQARGVGFLQWLDPHGPDHQWLYLPAVQRVRQITGSRKRESFVGTDFSYEDIGLMLDVLNWSEEDASSTLVGEDRVDGQICAIIALHPSEKQEVSYETVRIWIGRQDRALHRMEMEDEDGNLVKALTLTELSDVGAIPVAHLLKMENTRGGSHTIAQVRSIDFDRGIGDDMFTERRLERGG